MSVILDIRFFNIEVRKGDSMPRKKEEILPYEMVSPKNETTNDKPLSKVVGHESQKEELLLMLQWFKNYDELKKRNVSIPKGILLYGAPGNGKSLLMKEAIKYAGLPTFIFKGDADNICKGLADTFKKAKETGRSIVVIDELDLLIDKDQRVVRILQENLDGVDSSDDVLVMAATNKMWPIPEPILRPGRLEKVIRIPYPENKEAIELLRKHFNEFGVKLPDDFNEDEICLTLNNISCAGVRAIANDVVLRNGFDNITTEMIVDSIYRNTNQVQDRNKKDVYATAVHEAGHAVMAAAYPQFFQITRLDINQQGGKLATKDVEENYWPYDKTIADIKISYAGVLAQKIVCKVGSDGSISDLQRARERALELVNDSGYFSCSDALVEVPDYGNFRDDSDYKRNANSKKVDALLRKCEKQALKYLKRNKQKIIKLAGALFAKKFLKSSEVHSIINAV